MPDFTSTTISTSVLKIPIILENQKKISINIPDPVQGLSKNDISNYTLNTGIAGYLISENLINDSGYQALGIGDPYYYNTEKIVFD